MSDLLNTAVAVKQTLLTKAVDILLKGEQSLIKLNYLFLCHMDHGQNMLGNDGWQNLVEPHFRRQFYVAGSGTNNISNYVLQMLGKEEKSAEQNDNIASRVTFDVRLAWLDDFIANLKKGDPTMPKLWGKEEIQRQYESRGGVL
jgi:hypothetical protein